MLPIYLSFHFLTGLAGGELKAQSAQEDLKVGLVLSGGGAKCLAQIGALKVIEEAGVKIDYVGGTSMGAIIGAMYSMGYNVSEIEHYLRHVDWQALLTNEVPRDRLSFFDRKGDVRYFLTFPVIDGRIEIPKGLNYAQYILRELSAITQQSYRYDDFSQLPIPFLCVATNLQTGKYRAFEKGRLIDALRASSAFPSLFTPYEIEDSIYVDGGVVLNYPVELVAEKGMDFIIGIDMQDYLHEKSELRSVVQVLEQTSTFVNAQYKDLAPALTDIYISPKIPGAGVTTFDLFDSIVSAGEREARKHWDALVALAQRDASKSPLPENLRALPLSQFYVDSIIVNGNQKHSERYILGKLDVRAKSIVENESLLEAMERLYGTRYFETVDYSLSPTDTGYVLVIKVRENPSISSFSAGINYSDDFGAAALLNYTHRNLFFKSSRFSIDAALGEMPRAELNYFVDRGFIPTLGLKLRTDRFQYRTFLDLEPVNQRTYQDYSLDFFIQSTLKDAYAIGGGVQLESIDISQDFNAAGFEELSQGFINYYGFLDFDSFDDANFPTSGVQLRAQYRLIAERQGFESFQEPSSVIDLSYRQAFSVGPRLQVIGAFYGASTIGPNLSAPYQIYLGSMGQSYINYIRPFIGYRLMELFGRNAVYLRTDLNFEFLRSHFVSLKANVGKLEPTFGGLVDSDILLDGYAIGYTYNSLLGPLEFNLATSTNHDRYYAYVRLGFWF